MRTEAGQSFFTVSVSIHLTLDSCMQRAAGSWSSESEEGLCGNGSAALALCSSIQWAPDSFPYSVWCWCHSLALDASGPSTHHSSLIQDLSSLTESLSLCS